jgi:hypothetical protein
LDGDGKTCFLLQEQLRGYKNQDGETKKQKALPMIVLRKMWELANSAKDKAIAWLLIGALFFAMRSCEYLKTSALESSKRTKILRMKNIKFKKNGILLPHSSSDLGTADMVIITFEFQKNQLRNQTVHMFKTDDEILNPVLAWSKTVQRIWQTIPNASDDTKVCAFFENGRVFDIDSTQIRPKLRAIVELIGQHELGFSKEDIGLHSIRSGGAMAMFLSGVSEIIIQWVGRWVSFAFLEYIREQVDSFTIGVSQKMLLYENFHHLNENETKKMTDTEKQAPIPSEDGEFTKMPFTVHYSRGVLNDKIRSQQSHQRKENGGRS